VTAVSFLSLFLGVETVSAFPGLSPEKISPERRSSLYAELSVKDSPSLLPGTPPAVTPKKVSLLGFPRDAVADQRPDSNLIELKQEEQRWRIPSDNYGEKNKLPEKQDMKRFLAPAWRYLRKGDVPQALAMFEALSAFPEAWPDARYGMAMCYVQLRETKKAIAILEELAVSKRGPTETRSVLIPLLVKEKAYKKAMGYAGGSGSLSSSFVMLLILRDRLSTVKAGSSEEGEVLGRILDLAPADKEALSALGWRLLGQGEHEGAVEIFAKLRRRFPEEAIFLNGQVEALVKLKRYDEASHLVDREGRGRANSLKREITLAGLRERLSEVQAGSAQEEELLHRIMELSPKDKGTLSALGWRLLNRGEYNGAMDAFSKLHAEYPDEVDHVYGLASVYEKMGKDEDALALADRYQNEERFAAFTKGLKLKILWGKIAALEPDSPRLEALAREMLALNPEEDGIRAVLAWWYYGRDEYDKAYHEFNALYKRSPQEKGYAFGLVSSLRKLERSDEALDLATANKDADERLASVEAELYQDKAIAAFEAQKYPEAETYFAKAFTVLQPDEYSERLFRLSKYKQTRFGKAMTSIVGLPGFIWGSVTHDLKGSEGSGMSVLVNQGIDWLTLPGDIVLNTYAEYTYSSRTDEKLYFDKNGQGLGIELKKPPFRLGVEYFANDYSEQDKTDVSEKVYLGWYHEWYRYLKKRGVDGWPNIEALSGNTYGKIVHDLTGATGTGISGYVNQGVDLLTLPGDVILNAYAEYRFSLRTKDREFYNAHGPVLGMELQRKSFRFGVDYFREESTERQVVDNKVGVYLKWYYSWDLKPKE